VTDDHEIREADSAYHRRLPIGEVLDGGVLTEGDRASFDQVSMAALAPMLVPEQPRAGTVDRAACAHCRPSEHTIWHDDVWQVRAGWTGRASRSSAAWRRATTCCWRPLRRRCWRHWAR
jgi:hypothetical protein